MLFADDPGAFFPLQVEQARGGDTQGVFQVVGELLFQTGAEHALAKKISSRSHSHQPSI